MYNGWLLGFPESDFRLNFVLHEYSLHVTWSIRL